MTTFSSGLDISPIPLENTSANFQIIPMHNDDILEKWIVILLESDAHERQGANESLSKQFCNLVSDVKVFNCPNRCVDFLTDLLDEKVCLLLWKPVVNTLLPLIHDFAQLRFIYTLCDTESDDTLLKNKWTKFKGSFLSMDDIFYHFKQNIRRSEYDLISISTISPSTVDNLNDLDSSFMYSQLLKDILLKIQYNKSSKSEFVDCLRAEYAKNSRDLQSVHIFDENYSDKSPIWWYTKEAFIFEPLNRALRTQQTEIIVRMGFYIQDLHREIERLHKEQQPQKKMCVYRGQAMVKNDFEKLQKNQGGLLSFNNFLSTSTEKDVSLLFAESSASLQDSVGILFQIEINPSISTIPFASVEKVSNFSTEEEFLFSMHTICRIGEIKNIEGAVWQVNLTLTDDNDEQLKRISECIRQLIHNGSVTKSLGHLLFRMGEYDIAKKTYQNILLATMDHDVHSRPYLYYTLGQIAYAKSDYSAALSYYQQILEMYPLPANCNSFDVTDVYIAMATAHHSMGNYSIAAEFYELIIEIREESLMYSSLDLGVMYNSIAVTYTSMGRYPVAREYFQKSLNNLQRSLPSVHPDMSIIYNNMGMINFVIGEYETALQYHEKALQIRKKSFPPTHLTIATTLSNLATTYQVIGQYQTAIQYFENALTIMEKTSLCAHTEFAIIYNNIAQLYKTCSEYDKALPYCLKAIEMQKAIGSLGDPKLAIFYVNIALLHKLMGDFSTAIQYLQKAEKIQDESLPAKHLEFVRTYNGFGLIYHAQEQFWMALDYYQKALNIQQTFLPPTHPDLASIYNNLADVESHLNHEFIALDYIEKTLSILKACFSSTHPDVGRTYLNMGIIHMKMKNISETQKCFRKTFEIYKEALPLKHRLFGIFYANRGLLNCVMGKFPTALKHFGKAQEIFELVLPPNHPDLLKLQEIIAKAHQQMSSFGQTLWHF